MPWTRHELTARVEELGPGEELERFARGLTDEERGLLGDVLIERADYDYALARRIDERGWHLFQRPPDEPGHRPRHRPG